MHSLHVSWLRRLPHEPGALLVERRDHAGHVLVRAHVPDDSALELSEVLTHSTSVCDVRAQLFLCLQQIAAVVVSKVGQRSVGENLLVQRAPREAGSEESREELGLGSCLVLEPRERFDVVDWGKYRELFNLLVCL